MKVKDVLNSGDVKYSIAGKRHNIAKKIKSNYLESVHQVAKNMVKPLKSKIKNSTKRELKVHESVTIPLNDPFHDV